LTQILRTDFTLRKATYMTKRATKATKAPAPTVESVFAQSLALLHRGQEALQVELELVIDDKAGDNGHDKASRIAFLMQRVGSTADSLRKVEAARAKRASEMTLAQVIAWLRQQSKAVKAQVVRELHAMEMPRGVL
jgi:uncharacterized protein (UPF0371 family)